MDADEELFSKVPLNTNDPNPCSPESKDPAWRGLLIRLPKKAKLRRKVTVDGRPLGAGVLDPIPVCGHSFLDVPSRPVVEAIRLVAVDSKTGLELTGHVGNVDPSPDDPPPEDAPHSPETLAGVAVGSYFNPSLSFVVPLPPLAATYAVHAELRGLKSNVEIVEIVVVDEVVR